MSKLFLPVAGYSSFFLFVNAKGAGEKFRPSPGLSSYSHNLICTSGKLFDSFPIDIGEHSQTGQEGNKLRNGEGPPDTYGTVEPVGKEIGHGKNDDKLAQQGNEQTDKAVADGLEEGRKHDAQCGEDKADTDDAKSRNTDFQHLGSGIKEHEKNLGKDHKDQHAHGHDGHGDDQADFGGVQ